MGAKPKYKTDEERRAAIAASQNAYYYRNRDRVRKRKSDAAKKARRDPEKREQFLERERAAQRRWREKLTPERRAEFKKKAIESHKRWRKANVEEARKREAMARAKHRAKVDAERQEAGLPAIRRKPRAGTATTAKHIVPTPKPEKVICTIPSPVIVRTPVISDERAVALYFSVPIAKRWEAFKKLTPTQQKLAKAMYEKEHMPVQFIQWR